MFKRLSLKDFKTHKDTVLKFSPGVNVITGDTGQGKTNILLSLGWVKDNRPLGSNCIRRGQDSSSVVLEVEEHEDTFGIVRSRGVSSNSYRVEKNGEVVGDPFTAFGNSPPTQVSEILNLSDINIQKQRDSHFLVYSSAGQRATYVRSITKLDEIDQVVKLLSSKIRSKKGELSLCRNNIKSTEDKLVDLNKIDLALFEAMIADAKDRILKSEQIKKKIERTQFIVNKLKVLEENRIVIPDNTDEIFEDIDSAQKRRAKLSLRMSKIKTLVDNIKKIEVHKIVLPEDFTILSTIEIALKKFDNQIKMLDKLQSIVQNFSVVTVKSVDLDSRIKKLEEEEMLLKEQLQNCPSCGMKLTEKSKKVLLER